MSVREPSPAQQCLRLTELAWRWQGSQPSSPSLPCGQEAFYEVQGLLLFSLKAVIGFLKESCLEARLQTLLHP